MANEIKLKLSVEGSEKSAADFAKIGTAAEAAAQRVEQAFKRDVASMLATQAGKLESSLSGIGDNAEKTAQSVVRLTEKISLMGHLGAALTIGPALINTVRDMGAALVDAQKNAEKLRSTLEYSSGSNQVAGELEYLRTVTRDLGVDYNTTAQAYAKFSAAAKGSGMTLEQMRTVFEGVAQASVRFGLSVDETQGAFLALSQMASKGVVSAEEMRGQLAERLPGALKIAALAMGVTEREFSKMLETGQVIASEFLPKFGQALKDGISAPMGSLTQEINRFNSVWEQWKQAFANADGSGFKWITDGLNESTAAMKLLGKEAGIVHKALVAIGGFEFGAFGKGKFDTVALQSRALTKLRSTNAEIEVMEGKKYLTAFERQTLGDLKREAAELRDELQRLAEVRGRQESALPNLAEEFRAQQGKRKAAFDAYMQEVQSEKEKQTALENTRFSALTAVIGTAGADYEKALAAHKRKLAEINKSEKAESLGDLDTDTWKMINRNLRASESEERAKRSMGTTVDALNDAYSRQNAMADERKMSIEQRELAAALRQVQEQAERARESLSQKAATLKSEDVVAMEAFKQAVIDVGNAESEQAARVKALHEEKMRMNADWKTGMDESIKQYAASSKNAAQTAQEAFSRAFSSMEDAIVQFATTGKISFGNLANSIISDMIRMQVRAAMAPATEGMGNWLRGLFNGGNVAAGQVVANSPDAYTTPIASASVQMVPLQHSGGIVGSGEGSGWRDVSPSAFVGAPRFHTGGIAGDEVPTILQKGEGVFTKGQMEAIGGLRGSNQIIVNINESSSKAGTVQQTQDAGGKTILDVFVEKVKGAIAADIGTGGMVAGAMESQYGLNRAAGAWR